MKLVVELTKEEADFLESSLLYFRDDVIEFGLGDYDELEEDEWNRVVLDFPDRFCELLKTTA